MCYVILSAIYDEEDEGAMRTQPAAALALACTVAHLSNSNVTIM